MFRWWPYGDDPLPVLYGYGLDRWHFLGTTEISYAYEGQKPYIQGFLAFFVHKETQRRSFKMIGVGMLPPHKLKQLRNHPFYVKVAEQWEVGEYGVYYPVNEPSAHLHSYMRANYNMVWNLESQKWVEAEKGTGAKPIKKKPASSLRKKSTYDNITIVDFSKPPKN